MSTGNTNEFDLTLVGLEGLFELVRQAFKGAGFNSPSTEKGYEVHPALVWPMPQSGFRCRFLGVPFDILKAMKVSDLQSEMDAHYNNLSILCEAIQELSIRYPYREGGCWHLAMSPSKSVRGADQYRLILFAMIRAATGSIFEFRNALRDNKGLVLEVPSKKWIRNIIDLDGSAANLRDDAWNYLAQGRSEHWIQGLNIHSHVGHGELSRLDVFSLVELIRNSKNCADVKAGAPIRTRLILRPAGVAFAIGFRGRINNAVGVDLRESWPVEKFESWIWALSPMAQRLLTHIISRTNTKKTNFHYLRENWCLVTIFGSKCKEMTLDARGGLIRTLRRASKEIIENAPEEFRDFVLRALLHCLVEADQKEIGEKYTKSTGQISKITPGNHTPNLGKPHPPSASGMAPTNLRKSPPRPRE